MEAVQKISFFKKQIDANESIGKIAVLLQCVLLFLMAFSLVDIFMDLLQFVNLNFFALISLALNFFVLALQIIVFVGSYKNNKTILLVYFVVEIVLNVLIIALFCCLCYTVIIVAFTLSSASNVPTLYPS